MRRTLIAIKKSIEVDPKPQAYRDYLSVCKEIAKEEGTKSIYDDVTWLREDLTRKVRENKAAEDTISYYECLKLSYLILAKDDFESYLYYLEWNRKPEERFYQPRRRILRRVVKALQMLADDELDELFISMPPRIGKTTIILFFVTWLIGRDSERSNLYSAFSDTITSAFYSGVTEIIQDDYTYLWKDVFPLAKIVGTNAKEEVLDIDRRKRYHSLTSRSLYGTLNGACDCDGILICDDLIGGIEEALNKDRLISAWSKVDNNLIPRKKEKAKILWVGTRWSNADPIGLRLNILQTDRRFEGYRYKVMNLPALNEYGESNFDYDFNVGFSTQYYMQRKASFERMDDIASWNAQYMGMPVERGGTLFEPTQMRYYNGELPEDDTLIRKFMVVDPAFGGGDYCAGCVCYQYESGIYIPDVIFSNASKNFTQPLLANMIVDHKLNAVQFECNASTVAFKEKVEDMVRDKGYRCNITYKSAPIRVSKEVRIFDKAPEIREFIFLEGAKRPKEYEQFMQNVFTFQINGNNKHDDAPDVLSQAVDFLASSGRNVSVMRRMW